EERGPIPRLSKLAEMTLKQNRFHNLENWLWLRTQADPRKVFKFLLLGEAGVKLENNPKFIQWIKYVKLYQADQGVHRFTASDIFYTLLASKRTEEEVAVLFASLKKIPGLKKLAEDLQKAQFDSWRIKGKIPNAGRIYGKTMPSMLLE
ncbi:hypothetical protein PHYSODRAFT_495596, partial [Phytophthora sojae]